MASSEVKDRLQDIVKWSEAYQILEEFSQRKCEGECEKCGFIWHCNKVKLLMDK